MKKSLLFFLVTLFSIFMLVGCSDDSNDGKTTPPAEDNGSNQPSGSDNNKSEFADLYTGTYKVTFFGTQVTNAKVVTGNELIANMANIYYISNDCEKAKELYPDIIDAEEDEMLKNQCSIIDDKLKGNAELLDGAVLISLNNDNKLSVTSRVQLGGDLMDKSAPADKYQFTEYYPTSEYTDTSADGKGVKGWNYDSDNNAPSQTSSEFPESTYKVTKQNDGSYRIDMKLVDKPVHVSMFGVVADLTVDAVTTVLMEKVNEETTPLENKIQKEFPKADDTE